MFERRLRVLLVLLGVFTLAIVVRLVDLQLVRANQYRDEVAVRMKPRPQWFPFVRGRILDRTGQVLVQDSPTWELCVDYKIIAFDEHEYRERLVRWWSRRGRYRGEWLGLKSKGSDEEPVALRLRIEERLHLRIAEMWQDIKVFAEMHVLDEPAKIVERADRVVERVDQIRKNRIRFRDYKASKREIVVREENHSHPIVKGLDQERQVLARERFDACPWVHIEPSSARTYAKDTIAFAHVLGRMGRVSLDDLKDDPNKPVAQDDLNDDPNKPLAQDDLDEDQNKPDAKLPKERNELAVYRPSDIRGVSGVEYAAEQRLRGSRGRLGADKKQETKTIYEAAERGEDISLTISAKLQRSLYGLMQGAKMLDGTLVQSGAIVVLDVPTREVLALVSYPSYEPSSFSEVYEKLRLDMIAMPLRFRAVANHYAPGSILKPLVGLCGLSNGVINLGTRFHCAGWLDPAHPNRDRCWKVAGGRKHHEWVNFVEAIRGSCNIFMYHVGDLLTIHQMCWFFREFGLGEFSGIGLLEEASGINPWPGYITDTLDQQVVPAHHHQFAIGQGELSVTPVQAANVMATYASGRFKRVTLMRGNKQLESKFEPMLPRVDAAHWLAIRRGMYDVVNDTGGTAYDHARLEDDRYVLCGKTGSATVFAQPIMYKIAYREKGDEAVYHQEVPERAAIPAIKAFERQHFDDDVPVTVLRDQVEAVEWFPPVSEARRDETPFAHAWFGAFLQARGADGGPDFSVPSRIAFAVLVEFGESGGKVAGPLAKEVAATILEVLGDDLEY